MFEKFISEEVWNCTLKYTRMMRITKGGVFLWLQKVKNLINIQRN